MLRAQHTGYAGAPVHGPTSPPTFDALRRTVTVPLDDPVGLAIADQLASAYWAAGRVAEAGAVTHFVRDRVSAERLAALP